MNQTYPPYLLKQAKTALCLLLLLILPLTAWSNREPQYLNPPNSDPGLPFSDAVQVGPWLYLSGKIGNIPGTRELAEGGIAGETRQAMNNIQASLERYGYSMSDIVKCTVFLADIDEWSAMNKVYVQFFPQHKPARSALAASGLALNSRVEIECMAYQNKNKNKQ